MAIITGDVLVTGGNGRVDACSVYESLPYDSDIGVISGVLLQGWPL